MEVSAMVNQSPLGSEFVLLRDAMNQLLSESFVPSAGPRSGWGNGTGTRGTARPAPVDVYTTPNEAVVIAALPGMQPGELEITYNQNTLTISGTLPSMVEREQGEHATWYAHELWSGPVQRAITLPFEVDPDKAEATFEHGIARIVLPKAERAKPQKIAIRHGHGQQDAIEADVRS
jgi:HSP20 family protein